MAEAEAHGGATARLRRLQVTVLSTTELDRLRSR